MSPALVRTQRRHGLVAPDEVIAQYDVHLASQSASSRTAWGQFVVEQL